MNLQLSQNNDNVVRRFLNSDNTNDDFSFETYSPASVANCFGEDPNIGTPCTHNIRMTGPATCRWNYTCDYSPNRFPQYIWKAECPESSHPIFYPVPTLTVETQGGTGCLPFTEANTVYRWGQEKVAVACACTSSQQ